MHIERTQLTIAEVSKTYLFTLKIKRKSESETRALWALICKLFRNRLGIGTFLG